MKMKSALRILIGVIFCLLLLLLWTLPYNQRPEHMFPLERSILEQTLQVHELRWTVGESESFREGQCVYALHNQNGKMIATVDSAALDGMKALDIFLVRTSPSETALSEAIAEEEWLSMFDLACSLYGGAQNPDEVFHLASEFVKTESYEPQDRVIAWEKEINDVWYIVLFRPSVKYHGRFDLISIKLFNKSGYQSYSAVERRR